MCFVLLLIILAIFPQMNGEMNILGNSNTIVTEGERISSSENNSFPLINSDNYWVINLTNPGISFNFETESTFNFLINSIQIQIFNQFSVDCINENDINRMEYIVYYKIGTENRVVNLENANWTISGDTATVNIQPIPADRIMILRSVNSLGTHCMRYGLIGERIARVSVLFYDISLPNLVISGDTVLSDQGYTGVCSSVMCFGGKGKLMDGETDIKNFEETGVGWTCPSDKDLGCVFDLNIQLTNETDIDEIVIFGLSDGQIVTPQAVAPEYRIRDIEIQNKLFTITIRIDLEVSNIRMQLSIGNGKSLVLTEIAVYSDVDDVNLSVQSIAYNYVSIISEEIPTSSNIDNCQQENVATTNQVENENMSVANTVLIDNPNPTTASINMTSQTDTTFTPQNTKIKTNPNPTTVSINMTSQTDTTFTPQNTTTTIKTNPNSPNPEIGIDCKKQSIFLSTIGVLAIFMVTLLFNSVIVILLLLKNNRKIRKKLSILEQTKTDASTMATYIKSYKMRHAHTEQDLTVIQNRIAADDMYDRQEPIPEPIPEPKQEPVLTVNIIHNIDSGFASPSAAVPNIQYNAMGDFNSLSIPMTVNTSYAQIENLNSSAQRETDYDSCVQDEFEVPLEDNSAYSSMPTTVLPQICVENCDTSINVDTQLNIPMADNIGYISGRNESAVNKALVPNEMFTGKIENNDIKHIYSSIANECSIDFPTRKSGEFPSYNVLVHK